jgi:hypothetical protein
MNLSYRPINAVSVVANGKLQSRLVANPKYHHVIDTPLERGIDLSGCSQVRKSNDSIVDYQ